MKPRHRQALLWKLADLVQEHFDELRLLETLDMGSPIGRPRKRTSAAWEAEVLRSFAGGPRRSTARPSRTPCPALSSATR
jgi:aldehyde dehydrogenase (NAD+)